VQAQNWSKPENLSRLVKQAHRGHAGIELQPRVHANDAAPRRPSLRKSIERSSSASTVSGGVCTVPSETLPPPSDSPLGQRAGSFYSLAHEREQNKARLAQKWQEKKAMTMPKLTAVTTPKLAADGTLENFGKLNLGQSDGKLQKSEQRVRVLHSALRKLFGKTACA